jgi:hypothetical protein
MLAMQVLLVLHLVLLHLVELVLVLLLLLVLSILFLFLVLLIWLLSSSPQLSMLLLCAKVNRVDNDGGLVSLQLLHLQHLLQHWHQ